MKANPESEPEYTIWVKCPAFSRLMPGIFVEFGTMEDPNNFGLINPSKNPTKIKSVKIKSFGSAMLLVGPILSAEIELPISLLKTTETKRDEKIEEIITDGIQRI